MERNRPAEGIKLRMECLNIMRVRPASLHGLGIPQRKNVACVCSPPSALPTPVVWVWFGFYRESASIRPSGHRLLSLLSRRTDAQSLPLLSWGEQKQRPPPSGCWSWYSLLATDRALLHVVSVLASSLCACNPHSHPPSGCLLSGLPCVLSCSPPGVRTRTPYHRPS